MADNQDPDQEQIVDFRDVGASGLRRFSGFIFEEFLVELYGWKGIAIYKEMSLNDPTVGALLFAIKMLCRRVPWRVKSVSQEPEDLEAAEFLETCMDDMSMTWIDTIDEILSMLEYGYSVHEIVYKRRCGDVVDPTMRSKYIDGRIGWRKIPIRSQDTIYRWQFDDHGGIQGVEQLAPPHYYHVTIPVEKFLLFRTKVEKNNPEGRSILRTAYRPWYMKKNLENIEAIGMERDLAGLPVALVPPDIMSSGASIKQQAIYNNIKQIVTNIRWDEQAGVVFPQQYSPDGKPLYELKLLSTAGSRQFDTDKVISRYVQQIAMTVLADFLLIGHQKVGSFSLVSSRTNLFATAIGAYLDTVASVFNRYAVQRLFALNDFKITNYPTIEHGDLEAVDLGDLGDYIQKLSGAGMPLFPSADGELEKYLLKAAHLPTPAEEKPSLSLRVPPKEDDATRKIREIPGLPIQTPTGLEKPADTTPVNQKPPVETVVSNETGNTEMTSRAPNPQARRGGPNWGQW